VTELFVSRVSLYFTFMHSGDIY